MEWKFNPIKIWQLRDNAGLSRHKFGQRVGSISSQVKEWETGITRPSTKKLEQMCTVFEEEPNYFFAKDPQIVQEVNGSHGKNI